MDPIERGDFIIEYTGLIYEGSITCPLDNYLISINDELGRSYGFTIDTETEVDAINVGNLMRFANHS